MLEGGNMGFSAYVYGDFSFKRALKIHQADVQPEVPNVSAGLKRLGTPPLHCYLGKVGIPTA